MAIVTVLAWMAYGHIPPAPARISQSVAAYDNQYELFRDMEPRDQTLENSWIGFLQENVRTGRTGPIGDFIGNDSEAGRAPLYEFDKIPDLTSFEGSASQDGSTGPKSKVVLYDTVSGAETELGPGSYSLSATTTRMKVWPPLVVVVENAAGIKQTTRYVAGSGSSNLVIDKAYNFNKITLSLP